MFHEHGRSALRCGNGGARRKKLPVSLLACATLCLVFTGCDSCLTVVWNPPTGVITGSDPSPSPCTLPSSNGTVRPRMAVSAELAANTFATARHIFVTLAGIEAHTDAYANADSPGWKELAPQLAHKPQQVDLLASSSGAEYCPVPANVLRAASVPVDVYRQIRLRLIPNEQASNGPDHPAELAEPAAALEQNACGDAGFNCMVSQEGAVQRLDAGGAQGAIYIRSEQIAGGSFAVMPDSSRELEIQFNGYSLLSLPASQSTQLVPSFTAAAAAPCQSH